MVGQIAQLAMEVHGESWTVKELFTLPNEYIYWSIQIVMYPFMTGLVAGVFVLSSLYHVFGVEKLKEIARFSLVFSFALLPAAMMPLLLHLQQPFRGINVLMTPHFKACKIMAAIGIPVACFLHGYAGFIFGSVKANALWMTPLMPVIFICSAVVSGVALCILTYVIVQEIRKYMARSKMARWAKDADAPNAEELEAVKHTEVMISSNYLLYFMIAAITLEILDLIFRGYTQVKSWDILREVIMERDFFKIFILQYTIGNLIPFIMMILPGRTVRRTTIATVLVLFGVFMMRYNVVIGGQAFSLSFSGFMDYHLPVIPHNLETFKEGLFGALAVLATPFVLFYFINMFIPAFLKEESTH